MLTLPFQPSPHQEEAARHPPNHLSFPKKAAVASAENQRNLGSLQSRPRKKQSESS